jgi:hypothetical protein
MRARDRQRGGGDRGLEDSSAPVAVVVLAPGIAVRPREQQLTAVSRGGSARAELVRGQICSHWSPEGGRARRPAGLLTGDDLAVDVLLLDQERALAVMAVLERQGLLGAKPFVGDQRDERRDAPTSKLPRRTMNGSRRAISLLKRQKSNRAMAPEVQLWAPRAAPTFGAARDLTQGVVVDSVNVSVLP